MLIRESNKFGPLSEERLARFEREVRYRLPPDYREFLLAHNGGQPVPREFFISAAQGSSLLQWLYGLHDGPHWASLQYAFDLYRPRLPRGFLVIGIDEGGNLLCIALGPQDGGPIYFWDHESEGAADVAPGFDTLYLIADSFSAFLEGLTETPPVESSGLEQACQEGNLARVQQYLDAGGDVKRKNEHGHSLAITAATCGQLGVLDTLMAHGADLTGALSFAAQNGQTEMVAYLLAHGADPEERLDARADTPLMRAASFGYPDVVACLITYGADVNARNRYGQTALLQAGWADHALVIELLQQAGAR